MFRIVVFILSVSILGVVFAFLADYPAEIILSLPHWRLSLTPAVALALVLAFFVALWLVKLAFKLLVAPFSWREALQQHKKAQGYKALSSGLMAAFMGDKEKAEAEVLQAKAVLPENEEPMTALLLAQIEELRIRQKQIFGLCCDQNKPRDEDLPNRLIITNKNKKTAKDIQLLELKTAYTAALARQDFAQANFAATEVASKNASLVWANLGAISAQATEGKWEEAIISFDRFAKAWQKYAKRGKNEAIQKMLTYYRQVLLCGQVRDLFPYHPHQARQIILTAHKLNRDFVPATVLAAQILFQLDEYRKAEKILTAQWQKKPHPDLGNVYIKAGGRIDEAYKELERAQYLNSLVSDNPVGQILVAEAAFAAEDYPLAKEAAEKKIAQDPTQQAYLILAKIAKKTGEKDSKIVALVAKILTAPVEYAWYGDNLRLENWQALTPKMHRLGGCIWQRHETEQAIQQADIDALLAPSQPTPHYPNERKTALKQEGSAQTLRSDDVEEAARGVSTTSYGKGDEDDPTYLNVDNPGITGLGK